MSRYDPKFDLKIKVGHSDLYSQAIDFALYLEKYFLYKQYSFRVSFNVIWLFTWK